MEQEHLIIEKTKDPNIEKQKLLYDLSYKEFENSYGNIPDSLRDRVAKLIPLYTAGVIFVPTLIEKINKSNFAIGITYSIFALAVILFFISIIFTGRILYAKTFYFHSPSMVRDVISDENMSLEFAYRNIVQHLISASNDNKNRNKKMTAHFKVVFISFFSAISIGIILYIFLSLA